MFVITKRPKQIVLAAAATALLVSGAWLATNGISGRQAPVALPPPVDPGSATAADALVFVSGAVQHPGLYRLSTDARISDAIALAGGLLPTADPAKLPNLAARVHDGKQVNVPFAKGSSTSSGAVAKLDVNSAAADELDAVPEMPLGLGEAIVQYRTTWGPFTSLSQLRTALGLDTATMKAISPWLRVVAP